MKNWQTWPKAIIDTSYILRDTRRASVDKNCVNHYHFCAAFTSMELKIA